MWDHMVEWEARFFNTTSPECAQCECSLACAGCTRQVRPYRAPEFRRTGDEHINAISHIVVTPTNFTTLQMLLSRTLNMGDPGMPISFQMVSHLTVSPFASLGA